MYGIRYTGPNIPMAVELNALTAKRALEITTGLVERGYSPTITKDGVEYDYQEFRRAVESVRFGDDA